jgi:hypothetical protein
VRRAERRAGRRAILALAVASLVAATAPADAATAAVTRTVTLRTVPATSGVRLLSGGRVVRTDARGLATLALPTRTSPGGRGGGSLVLPQVLPTRLASGEEARFGGFFDGQRTIGLSLFTRTRLRYTRLDGRPIPAGRVDEVLLKSSTGVRVTVHGGLTPELQATRVVRGRSGLRSTTIRYSVEEVHVGGGNVVHRSQKRFVPMRTRELRVPLLLFSLSFTSADALFGNPAGSGVLLRYPDGHTARLALHDGAAKLDGLPRGEYRVKVDAPGYAFERPVSLSRDQLVDMQVVSVLDLAVVFGVLGSTALALLVVGRPTLRRRLRRLLGRPVTARR